jgi:hypothetical protein
MIPPAVPIAIATQGSVTKSQEDPIATPPARVALSIISISSFPKRALAVIIAPMQLELIPITVLQMILASGVAQHRIICNTVIGISSSCMGAMITARALFGKLEMEIMLNATLAGGVAIGSSCDLVTEPWVAMAIGTAGGIISALGF